MRKETDALGEMLLPDDVYYGIQTERNRQVLDMNDDTLAKYPAFIKAMAQVKNPVKAYRLHLQGGPLQSVDDRAHGV